NALSFLPLLIWVAMMKLPGKQRATTSGTFFEQMADGMKYVRRNPVIFRLLILSAFVCLVAWPYVVLLPIFAKVVLKGDAHTLAWLTGVMAFGAVLGSYFLTSTSGHEALKRKLIQAVVLCGASLVLF